MKTCTASTKLDFLKYYMGILILLMLSACTAAGPDYHKPDMRAPDHWQTPLPHRGKETELTQWWEQFGDPVLVTLIQAAEVDSPDLAEAWASIERARANVSSVTAGFGPSLDSTQTLTRSQQQSQGSSASIVTSRSSTFDASWEADLFGKVRRNVEAAQARVEARIDDWHDARVSLAAEVADTYTQYRGCVLLMHAYVQESVSMTQTTKATLLSVEAGFTAPADGALSRASLAGILSSQEAQQVQCNLLVKSLVELTGSPESQLRDLLDKNTGSLPGPAIIHVNTVPANALRQRPDIASLERELAACGAEIGAAQADLYPGLTLSGSISVSASSIASSATTWSFGPTLSIPLFDSGKRRAAVASSQAGYQSALAQWRDGVRTAIKEVEQALVNLEGVERRTAQAADSLKEYRSYLIATNESWKTGSASLLTLEEARRSALDAEIKYIELQRDWVQDWIALYKALGGGWREGQSVVAYQHS